MTSRPALPADRILLRRDGVAVLLDLTVPGLPAVLHWVRTSAR